MVFDAEINKLAIFEKLIFNILHSQNVTMST